MFLHLTDNLDINGIPPVDFHIHTNYTDGQAGIEAYVKSAITRELKAIAITDHARKTSTYIPDYCEKIEELKNSYNLSIYKGVETKIINLDGDIDLSKGIAEHLDIILGTLHRFPTEQDDKFVSATELMAEDAARIEADSTINMIKKKQVDIIAHPTRIFCETYNLPFPQEMLREIVKVAKMYGVAIECNAKIPYSKQMLKICMEENAILSIGSDAHTPREVGTAYRYLKSLIRNKTNE